MIIYVLRKHTVVRPHGIHDKVIMATKNRELVFGHAAELSRRQMESKSSWEDITYWIHIFESKNGKLLDEIEFSSDRLKTETFGKIVRHRGARDRAIIGSWHKE